jgi:hypothetical protein
MNATEWEPYEPYTVIQGARLSKRGMTIPELQPAKQTINVPEVQEQSTVRYIHQFRRLAVANAPGDKSTSGLREQR